MPTTVSLQGTLSYGVLPLWILFFILISPLIIRKIKKHKEKAELKKQKSDNKPVVKKVPPTVKETYVKHLEGILNDYKTGKNSSRKSYQLLSFFLREFCKEYSGIDVTRKTLAEIRTMDNEVLEALIEEYYACEFAPDKEGDIEKSINNTILKIERW